MLSEVRGYLGGGVTARAVAPARDRIRACVSQRHHVEQVTIIAIVMIISSLMELHLYTALGIFSVVAIGCRDILVVLLFAEEKWDESDG